LPEEFGNDASIHRTMQRRAAHPSYRRGKAG
jgi:hypothetical protein